MAVFRIVLRDKAVLDPFFCYEVRPVKYFKLGCALCILLVGSENLKKRAVNMYSEIAQRLKLSACWMFPPVPLLMPTCYHSVRPMSCLKRWRLNVEGSFLDQPEWNKVAERIAK